MAMKLMYPPEAAKIGSAAAAHWGVELGDAWWLDAARVEGMLEGKASGMAYAFAVGGDVAVWLGKVSEGDYMLQGFAKGETRSEVPIAQTIKGAAAVGAEFFGWVEMRKKGSKRARNTLCETNSRLALHWAARWHLVIAKRVEEGVPVKLLFGDGVVRDYDGSTYFVWDDPKGVDALWVAGKTHFATYNAMMSTVTKAAKRADE